jgi:hypothetical protein
MNPDLSAIIQSSREARPSDFQSHINDVLGQRVVDALDRRRQEMAAAVLNHKEEMPDESDTAEVSDEINSDEIQADEDDTQIEEPNGQDA